MDTNSSPPKKRNASDSSLAESIIALRLAEGASNAQPAKNVFSSAGALLAMIKESMVKEQNYVRLGLSCADVCQALYRKSSGRRLDELSRSMLGAIEELTTILARIQQKIDRQSERPAILRFLNAKNDRDTIAAWGRDLDRIRLIFNEEVPMKNHMLLDRRYDVQAGQGGTSAQIQLAQVRSTSDGSTALRFDSISLGELPPPRPRACFGRDGLIERIVGIANGLNPFALIGAGGIGKTSVALAVLHHDSIKERFGDNRRFIRCDQFPASRANFLRRLSQVIGAGVENPEDLAPLRSFLSCKEMLIVLDNAESILDPQGTDAREIHTMVKDLSHFSNICVGITSRISNVPPLFMRPIISTLSMEAACDIFYSIYGYDNRSKTIEYLLQRLDFHALSITLLATTASENVWDHDRLAKEWDVRRAQVLRTDHNESLAATIELSLTSSMFRNLGPNARDLLGVVAFFPQGIDEKNLDWLFPTVPNRRHIFDRFCILSLTYRSNGFIIMLAPIQDYLSPPDPKTSPLLCTTKDHYFTRLSVELSPSKPGFGEAQWIKSEDNNVEHLLNIFTSIDMDALNVWDACYHFMEHIYWQKPRQTVLVSKIEGLPDYHPSKANCLFALSRLFGSIGNPVEEKRLLTHTLNLWREQGEDFWIAQSLQSLSLANQSLGLSGEGIEQAREALDVFEHLGDVEEQLNCLQSLASLFIQDGQLDAAEETVARKIDLLPEKDQEFQLCQSHSLLGEIYRHKREKEKAIYHFKTALTIASPFNWQGQLFGIHYEMAEIFRDEGKLEVANAHIEQAKSFTADNAYNLGRAMEEQAQIWYQQHRLEEAKSEALCAFGTFERLGAVADVERCQVLLQTVEQAMENFNISSGSDSDEAWAEEGSGGL